MQPSAKIPPAFRRQTIPESSLDDPDGLTPVSVERFLQSLPLVGIGNLIVRGGGLSLFQPCRLRLDSTASNRCLKDTKIGLTIKVDFVESVWLIEPIGEPPRFEVVMEDSANSVSLYPSPGPATQAELDEIRNDALAYRRLTSTQPPLVSAIWLDQELEGISEAWQNQLFFQPEPKCFMVNAQMRSSGLILSGSLDVFSLDLIGDIFRLASADGTTVIHFHSMNAISSPERGAGGITADLLSLQQNALPIESRPTSFLDR